jgi:hypothetical protein
MVAGPAHHPDDLIPLGEQELGEVGAVLAGDAGDEGLRHGGLRGPVVWARAPV